MGKNTVTVLLCLLVFFVPGRNADSLLVHLSEQDRASALKEGEEQGVNVIKHVNRSYRFGEEGAFMENGIVRTKWSKLAVLSGLMADRGRKPTEEEQAVILDSPDLQVDIHTFGDKMDFANAFTVYILQKGRRIEPGKISADDVAYAAQRGEMASGFPQHYATIRSYFSYDEIDPDEKAEIVLVKDKKKVVFEVNFADYR